MPGARLSLRWRMLQSAGAASTAAAASTPIAASPPSALATAVTAASRARMLSLHGHAVALHANQRPTNIVRYLYAYRPLKWPLLERPVGPASVPWWCWLVALHRRGRVTWLPFEASMRPSFFARFKQVRLRESVQPLGQLAQRPLL